MSPCIPYSNSLPASSTFHAAFSGHLLQHSMQHSFGKAFHHSMRSGSDLSVIGLVVPTSSLMMDNTDDDFASTYPDLEEHHEGLALVGEEMWQCEEIIAKCQLEIDTGNCGWVASVAWLEKKRAAKVRMDILQTIYDELLAEWQTQYSSSSWLVRKGASWQGGEFDPTDYGPPPASADPQNYRLPTRRLVLILRLPASQQAHHHHQALITRMLAPQQICKQPLLRRDHSVIHIIQ